VLCGSRAGSQHLHLHYTAVDLSCRHRGGWALIYLHIVFYLDFHVYLKVVDYSINLILFILLRSSHWLSFVTLAFAQISLQYFGLHQRWLATRLIFSCSSHFAEWTLFGIRISHWLSLTRYLRYLALIHFPLHIGWLIFLVNRTEIWISCSL
jgi:hypothetical protein